MGKSIYFRGVSPYALCNMESLINKFTNKYILLFNMLKVRGLETKDTEIREVELLVEEKVNNLLKKLNQTDCLTRLTKSHHKSNKGRSFNHVITIRIKIKPKAFS